MMRMTAMSALVAGLSLATEALAGPQLKTCSANKAYCDSWAKKKGWSQPECSEAFERCMSTGEWHTGTKFGRLVRNVERR